MNSMIANKANIAHTAWDRAPVLGSHFGVPLRCSILANPAKQAANCTTRIRQLAYTQYIGAILERAREMKELTVYLLLAYLG